MRFFVFTIMLVVWLALCAVSPAGTPSKNVLLIIADDLGIDSLTNFNDNVAASLPPTPTINALCASGISFTSFYAYPTCSPSRSAIMTGRYGFRTGVLQPTVPGSVLVANEYTLPEALRDAGVVSNRLASIGKWHLGGNSSAPNTIGGWTHFSGTPGGGVSSYTNWSKVVNGTNMPNHTVYATSDNVDDAVSWIGSQGTNAWFLWIGFNAGHTPFHKPPVDLHDYDALSGIQTNIDANPRPYFEAMIQAMDTEIGRLLGAIDTNETTIIFVGDNGTAGNVIQLPFRRQRSKGSLYEGGVRVPMIVTGAAISNGVAGTTYDEPLHIVDLYATILDMFDIVARDQVPEELVLDSRSFMPVLCGDSYTRDAMEVTTEADDNGMPNSRPGRAIVDGTYKYIAFQDGTSEFYNVDTDISENNNLLEGVLDTNQQVTLTNLLDQLATYVNVPQIYHLELDDLNGATLDIGWFANAGFTLQRNQDLATTNWLAVTNQVFQDNGEATLFLRDPTPSTPFNFYRVSTP